MSTHADLVQRLRQLASEHAGRCEDITARFLRDAADAIAAVSPQPCAMCSELTAALREIEQLYDTDRVAQPHARRIEKLFDRYLHGDDDVSPPAALAQSQPDGQAQK